MSRGKYAPETPIDAPTTEKVVISFRLPSTLAALLRKQAENEGGSLNDVVVTVLNDVMNWFATPKPIAEMLEADRNAFGDSKREYLRRLLTYRYEEIVGNEQAMGKKPGGRPTRK